MAKKSERRFNSVSVNEARAVNLRVEPFDVYVGRAGKGQSGYFGNPYRVGDCCRRCGVRHLDNASALPCFEAYMWERLANDPEYRAAVGALRGKRLGCFCKPAPCHGDALAAAAEALNYREPHRHPDELQT